MADDRRPGVAIWRTEWLPWSETFIPDQIAALQTWRPLKLGLRQLDEPLVPADVAPFSFNLSSRARWRLRGVLGHRRAYLAAMRAVETKVLHAHFADDALLALPLVTEAQVPLVVTCHGYDVTQGGVETRASELRPVFERARALVAVSEFVAHKLRAVGAPTEKIHVRYIGSRIDPLPSAPREGVLFVGRLVEKKGILDLLDAIARLPAELRSTTPVTVVGDGPLRSIAEAAARERGLQVTFTGRRDPLEVRALMARSAVLCGPSKTASDGDAEGFGLVFLEAAVQRVPVVAYNHGGVPEAVAHGESGLLVPEGDVDRLADSLQQLLEDRGLAERLGAQGYERARDEFDITRRTQDLERLYDEITG